MPTFDELPYGGNELTCRNCSGKTFYSTFTRWQFKDHAKYEWGYQCQDCGDLIMNEENIEGRQYLIGRCKCGGQFRRDKPLFCKNCKFNKTDENVSDEYIVFIHENGEPNFIQHKTSPERKGQIMTDQEIHKFGVELISGFYKSQGMIIENVNTLPGYEYPQYIMRSINNKIYYVVVKTAVYPIRAESLYTNKYSNVIDLALQNNAIPVFAGLSLANVMNKEGSFGELICGSSYAVSFKNLIQMA